MAYCKLYNNFAAVFNNLKFINMKIKTTLKFTSEELLCLKKDLTHAASILAQNLNYDDQEVSTRFLDLLEKLP